MSKSTPGTVAVLSVGDGDLKLSFDPKNPQERIRAARIVADMLKRGYALLVDRGDGQYQRIKKFDEEKCEYIIADFDSATAQKEDARGTEPEKAGEEKASAGDSPGRQDGGKAVGKGTRSLPAESARAVAVPRTAGG